MKRSRVEINQDIKTGKYVTTEWHKSEVMGLGFVVLIEILVIVANTLTLSYKDSILALAIAGALVLFHMLAVIIAILNQDAENISWALFTTPLAIFFACSWVFQKYIKPFTVEKHIPTNKELVSKTLEPLGIVIEETKFGQYLDYDYLVHEDFFKNFQMLSQDKAILELLATDSEIREIETEKMLAGISDVTTDLHKANLDAQLRSAILDETVNGNLRIKYDYYMKAFSEKNPN